MRHGTNLSERTRRLIVYGATIYTAIIVTINLIFRILGIGD